MPSVLTFITFMAWTAWKAGSERIPAEKCRPIALVTRRSKYSELLRTSGHDVSLHNRSYPALSQMALFKNSSYIEMDTCPCDDSGHVYSLLSQGLQKDSAASVLCSPKITCTYDRDRYPPVLYQITCGVSTTVSDPFTCRSINFDGQGGLSVLRRKNCKDSNDRESDTWRWVREKNFYVGCEVEIGNAQAIRTMWRANC